MTIMHNIVAKVAKSTSVAENSGTLTKLFIVRNGVGSKGKSVRTLGYNFI